MNKAFIDPQRCKQCDDCQAGKACPINAIFSIDNVDPRVIEMTQCRGCGDCATKCVANAISLRVV